MIKIKLAIFALFVCFGGISSVFAAGPAAQSCGVKEPCEAGYYCSGAKKQATTGICLPTGINIALCRFMNYIQGGFFKILTIFAAVFAGLYLFIGKLTYVKFGQMIVGIGLLFGAEKLINQTLGSNSRICTAQDASSCKLEGDFTYGRSFDESTLVCRNSCGSSAGAITITNPASVNCLTAIENGKESSLNQYQGDCEQFVRNSFTNNTLTCARKCSLIGRDSIKYTYQAVIIKNTTSDDCGQISSCNSSKCTIS